MQGEMQGRLLKTLHPIPVSREPHILRKMAHILCKALRHPVLYSTAQYHGTVHCTVRCAASHYTVHHSKPFDRTGASSASFARRSFTFSREWALGPVPWNGVGWEGGDVWPSQGGLFLPFTRVGVPGRSCTPARHQRWRFPAQAGDKGIESQSAEAAAPTTPGAL